MSAIVNKQICLNLNKLWQPLKFVTVEKAFSDLCSLSKDGTYAHLAMDLTYELNPNGTYNTDVLLNARPVDINEWMDLPVRSCDLSITCARREIRVPTITICSNFDKLTKMLPKFSSDGIWERDKGTCQATGRKLQRHEGDLGHNIAKTNGGKRSWANIALLDKKINRMQGTKTFAEMGWDIKPKAPVARTVFFTVEDVKHPSQIHFVERN